MSKTLLDFRVSLLRRTVAVVLANPRFLIQNPLISIRPRGGSGWPGWPPTSKKNLCLVRSVYQGYCVVYPFLLDSVWVLNSLWISFSQHFRVFAIMRYHSIRISRDIFCCSHQIFLHSDSLLHFGYIYLATDHLRIWSCYRIVTNTIVVISIILVHHPPPNPALLGC